MNRREALQRTSIILGGTIIGAEAFLSGCAKKTTEDVTTTEFISTDQISLLNEIGEIIIPETPGSPGAKTANVGEFMKVMVRDCYSPEEQEVFKTGIEKFENDCQKATGKNFLDLSTDERYDFLLTLEKEANDSNDPKHYYKMVKQLTVWGFVSSEPGATQVFRHVDVPGRYDACIPLEEGGKAWV